MVEVELNIGEWFDQTEINSAEDIYEYIRNEWMSEILVVFDSFLYEEYNFPSSFNYDAFPTRYGELFEIWFKDVCESAWAELVKFGVMSIGDDIQFKDVEKIREDEKNEN